MEGVGAFVSTGGFSFVDDAGGESTGGGEGVSGAGAGSSIVEACGVIGVAGGGDACSRGEGGDGVGDSGALRGVIDGDGVVVLEEGVGGVEGVDVSEGGDGVDDAGGDGTSKSWLDSSFCASIGSWRLSAHKAINTWCGLKRIDNV